MALGVDFGVKTLLLLSSEEGLRSRYAQVQVKPVRLMS